MKSTIQTCAVVCAVCALQSATAEIHRVDRLATGASSGATWADAFTDLQSALNAAQDGDEVWVAASTYHPTADGDRSISFALRDGVAVYGGFAGDEAVRDARDIDANPTILSGDLNNNDLNGFANTSDNSYHVVVAHMVGSATTLDGFTITGGHANGPGFGATPDSKEQGSGINIYHGQPTIRNCVLLRNWVANHGAVNDHGGATFIRCEFRENYSAQFGAGLYIHHDSQTTAMECQFIDNEAAFEGGGAYSRSMHGAMLHECYFEGNRANFGAGIYHAPASMTHVSNCEFRANVAILGGGGVYTDFADGQITDCAFYANKAGEGITSGGGGGGGSGGGGTFSAGGAPSIERCTFVENLASFGGGVYFNDGSTGTVADCVFIRGVAEEAGGLYALGADVTVDRCLFVENRAAQGSFSVGGGLSTYFSNTVTRDCTFIGNFAELGGGGMYTEGNSPIVANCQFIQNSTFGEIGWGGGLMNSFITFPTIINCTFVGNTAIRGGAIVNMFAAFSNIVNCTMTQNTATIEGGGISNIAGSDPRVSNSIVWANSPDQFSGTIDARYVCVQAGYPGVGNISADPRFVDADGLDNLIGTEDDNLRLAPDSPCIDAGSNALAADGTLVDLALLPRFTDEPFVADSGEGLSPLVDMGAFEAQPCIGDVDGDRAVGLTDLAVLLAHFGQPSGATWPDGDLSSDQAVGLDDLALLLSRFGLGCD
ncbi:MAG: hypothetical protein ACKVS9_01010 [Phycisphaerae bacterium]